MNKKLSDIIKEAAIIGVVTAASAFSSGCVYLPEPSNNYKKEKDIDLFSRDITSYHDYKTLRMNHEEGMKEDNSMSVKIMQERIYDDNISKFKRKYPEVSKRWEEKYEDEKKSGELEKQEFGQGWLTDYVINSYNDYESYNNEVKKRLDETNNWMDDIIKQAANNNLKRTKKRYPKEFLEWQKEYNSKN